jgi:hypothetical protein
MGRYANCRHSSRRSCRTRPDPVAIFDALGWPSH